MVTKEEFLRRWDILMKKIELSQDKYKGKKCLKLLDIYFTKAKIKKNVGYAEYLVCFKDYTSEVDIPRDNIKGNKIIIDSNDLYNYYLNGWNKKEELLFFKKLYKNEREFSTIIYNKQRNELGKFYTTPDFLDACQHIWKAQREMNRLKNEKRAVSILLKYLKLK